MTSLSLPLPRSVDTFESLPARQPLLTRFGTICLALMLVALLASMLDPRLLDSGTSPWVKPTKFLLSVGIFALTAAWFYGYVDEKVRHGRMLRWTAWILMVSGGFELFWITFQAANGTDSHYNQTSILNAVMFGLMGVFALSLTATTVPLARAIARNPAPGLDPVQRQAAIIGLWLTWLLGTASGIVLSINGAHNVGAEASSLPLFHWNQLGGDLRVAHFLGLHAEQILPIGAAILSIAGLTMAMRRRLLLGGTAVLVLLFASLTVQALAGRPLFAA